MGTFDSNTSFASIDGRSARRRTIGLSLIAVSLFAGAVAISAEATSSEASSSSFAASTSACSSRAAVLSIGRIFRGLGAGDAKQVLAGLVEPARLRGAAWGFQIERPEEGPFGLNENASSSRLIATSARAIDKLAARRRARDERLSLVAIVLDTPPSGGRIPVTIYFLRRANDVVGYGWGDGGIAKGEFDCTVGRLMWFRGGHTPSQVPVAASASGRLVCATKGRRDRVFVPSIGWGCAA